MFWLFAAGAFLVDFASKRCLWHSPGEGPAATVLIPRVLQIVSHPGNRGGPLGLPGGTVVYAVLALVALPAIFVLFATTEPHKGLVHAGLGLIAGGAAGNLGDRILLGFVRDFIDLHWADVYHWHTFNLADTAICVGFGLVVWDVLFCSRAEKPTAREAG